MCLTCGCNLARTDHGVAGHLTFNDVKRSADIDGITVPAALKAIKRTMKADRKLHPEDYAKPDVPNAPVPDPPRKEPDGQ